MQPQRRLHHQQQQPLQPLQQQQRNALHLHHHHHHHPPPPPSPGDASSLGGDDDDGGGGDDVLLRGGDGEGTLACLWVLSPLAATVSVLVIVVAMSTNQWLHTEEKMNNPLYNGTGDKDYLSKLTTSGLWKLCYTNPGGTSYDCDKIDYFNQEGYSPDPSDSTMAIPYTVTRSVTFFLSASLLLCSGYCCCMVGQCRRRRTLYTFVSGVIFIVTGLIMLFGLIMYISIFKAEIGSKLRPRSQLQPPAFDYWYGYSFLLYVSGLITTNLAGISSIFLFILKVQYEWQRKHVRGLLRSEKSGGERGGAGAGKAARANAHNHQPASMYPRHYDRSMYYPCRRHPQAYVNSNSAIHFPAAISYPSPVVHQKRYFFSKEPVQESPCSVHRPSNSLKDVSNFYDFPPPPTISYQFDDPYDFGGGGGTPGGGAPPVGFGKSTSFPRDLTANTLSTTADVVNCDDQDFLGGGMGPPPEGSWCEDFPSPASGMSGSGQAQEFVTFDLDQQPSALRPAQSSVSIIGGGGANMTRKGGIGGFDSDTLRRTTPV